MREIAARLLAAERVLIHAGQGTQDAPEALEQLALRLGALVVTTTSARGVVAEDAACNVVCDSDSARLNALVRHATVVLALGVLTSATTPALQSLLLRHAGQAPMLATSVNVCAFNIGIAAGSALGGGLVAADGLRWLGLAAAGLSLVALAISYAAIPRRPAPASV